MLKIKIVHLPNGRWCLRMPRGQESPSARYEERILWHYDEQHAYVGQTAFWGNKAVWRLGAPIEFEVKDESLKG